MLGIVTWISPGFPSRLMSKRCCAQCQLRERYNGKEPALHATTTLLALKNYESTDAGMEVMATGKT